VGCGALLGNDEREAAKKSKSSVARRYCLTNLISKNMNFKNENAKQLFDALMSAAQDFHEKRQGAGWRNMVFGVAAIYPEDRAKILSLVETKPVKKKKTGARLAPKHTGGTVRKKGCADCPDGAAYQKAAREEKKKKPIRGSYSFDKIEGVRTIEDIIDSFRGNGNVMKAYCDAVGIALPGNSRKPETIAKYILKHIIEVNSEEE
jgi:hypothetical protein